MRLLESKRQVKTSYGGKFVDAIDGPSPATSSGGRSDWFYFVNGIEASVGAADRTLSPGDVVQWDYRRWDATMHMPAIVGAYPEPFVRGSGGKRLARARRVLLAVRPGVRDGAATPGRTRAPSTSSGVLGGSAGPEDAAGGGWPVERPALPRRRRGLAHARAGGQRRIRALQQRRHEPHPARPARSSRAGGAARHRPRGRHGDRGVAAGVARHGAGGGCGGARGRRSRPRNAPRQVRASRSCRNGRLPLPVVSG